MKGTVKFYVPDRAYGFVTKENGVEYCFSGCQLVGDIRDPMRGDLMNFDFVE